ncbi:MAG TPA: MarR family transcriptional regulator [Nocardioides sp.]|uniref:MarR family winged helix-turn-helix transcriptional regulator n=1 Tax=Nocardioides sp. TaxID=35761 RepID=UPI002E2FEDA3|nr:MarR family transcriptional regulator [Nocardioides sp.]HEX5087533.1 MarR family transcriptional regulator [Nocardioides sp.]
MEEASDSRELVAGLEDQPGHLLWRAAARVTLSLGAVLPAGMDIHAYAALLALAGGAPRSQQSLADTIDVSRTTMAKVAAGLAEEGLVERVRNPADRRSYSLTRTAEGAAAARHWRRHAEDLEDALTPGFSLAEREELRQLLLGTLDGELAHDTPEPLLESLGFLITRAHLRMHRGFSEALAPLQIVPAHFGLLTTLATLGAVSQAEIGRRLGISGASVVQMVDDLEAKGLVERRRLEWDRRTQLVHPTPAAGEVLDRAGQLATQTLAERLGALDSRQTKRLVVLLQRFVTGE